MVSVAGLRKAFGARTVLDGLSFEIARGEVYGLLGPNGCGKSTAINVLCNLLDADAGRVLVAGEPVSAATQRRIGACPQETALYRDLLPRENLDFFARLYGLPKAARRARIDELVALFRLGPYERTRVLNLSGGWRQRVNMAVALVHRPELLILDEPTSAVDVEARHELWTLIEGLRRDGITLLLTTHHLDEAERLCSRIGIVKGGRIAAEGTVAELLARVPAQAVAWVGSDDAAAVRARAAARGWALREEAARIGCLLPRQLSLREVIDAFDGVPVNSVSVQPVTLELAYREVMRGPG